MLLKIVHRGGDCARRKRIVGVKPRQDLAVGSLPTLVDGRSLAAIFMALDQCTAVVFFQNIGCIIRRAFVDNLELNRRIILRQDALDRVAQKRRLVVSWRYYRDERLRLK